jgi:hypothetical protein
MDWISVSERLPGLGQLVLVAFDERVRLGNRIEILYRDDDAPDRPWWWESLSGNTYNDVITHWMPLPVPPTNDPQRAMSGKGEHE